MKDKIHRFIASYVVFLSKHNTVLVWFFLGLLLLSGVFASGLKLKSDIKELLPPNYEGVGEMKRVLARVGGVGSLIVVVEGPSASSNERFMDDLNSSLNKFPKGYIRYVEYNASEVKKFYKDNFLYYLNVDDLNTIYDRLKRRVDYEKFRHTPFYFSLDSDNEQDYLDLNFNDIKKRNEDKFSSPISTFGNYYGDRWGHMLIMIVRPYGSNITIKSAKKLIDMVKGAAEKLNPNSYDGGVKVSYCGNVVSTIEEYQTLKHDILSTAFLCVFLVAVAIFLYFLRIRVIFLLGGTLLVSIVWTFAIIRLTIGYLNAQTAFLGSIIVGTGINYGIILMARYIEERKHRQNAVDSMTIAVEKTLKPTLLAASTTAVAFAVLLLARIRGLSQFGFIGATGVVLCWVSSLTVLPSIMLMSERFSKIIKPRAVPQRKSALFLMASRFASKSPVVILSFAVIILLASSVEIIHFIPNSIEYDFTKLRNRVSVTSGTEAIEKRVSRLFKSSMTPSVVLVNSPEQGPEVCKAVARQNSEYHPKDRRVGSCSSIYDLLPTDQDLKLPIMAKIARLLDQHLIEIVTGENRKKVDTVRRSILGRKLNIDDLPDVLTRHFSDLAGNKGAIVFINPRPGMLLSDGRNLMRFADTIKNIKLADGEVFHAASASIIFSDLIRIIKDEAPYLTMASLLCVIAFVFITLKKTRLSFEIIIALIWSVIVMMGAMAFMDIKLNFFNFIVLPLTFGIGVDYSLNVAIRLREEGTSGVIKAIRQTGVAVILCSATTMIGYFVLTAATNQALATFGVAAVIGEMACLFSAIFVVPALVVFVDRIRERKKHV